VKLVDANVLLYADNQVAAHHLESRSWLTAALSGAEPVLVPWLSVLAYLRVSTLPQIHHHPQSVEGALRFLRTVLDAPCVLSGEPDHRHLDRVAVLLSATGIGGNLVNDAHLAALALQYEATVVSYDNDFSRFPGVRWERPTSAAG
jgi:toxin-antitoxin system PIN domain toxin